jgi:hypothetical protein
VAATEQVYALVTAGSPLPAAICPAGAVAAPAEG